MIAALILMSIGAFAQEPGQMAVGVNGAYGFSSNYKTFGVGAKFQYAFMKEFRAEASGTYFFKKDYVSAWDVNLNAHYLIPISEGVNVYPLAGLTIFGVKADIGGAVGQGMDYYQNQVKQEWLAAGGSASDFDAYWAQVKSQYSQYADDSVSGSETRVGFNVGGGIEYFVSPNIKINAEIKYQYTKDSDWPVISVGAAYVF